MSKPDWVPLFIPRLKGSAVWKWLPHVFGWYIRLLVEMADSSKPGYLPNDPARLCRLANGLSEDDPHPRNWQIISDKFAVAWASTLQAKFLTTDDRRWIYHETMLQAIEEKEVRSKVVSIAKRERVIKYKYSLTSQNLLQKLFEEAYSQYPRHVGKRASEKAFFGAIGRLCALTKVTAEQAAESIKLAAAEYARTPVGQRGKFTPHMSTWLNQDRHLDDRKEWQDAENDTTAERAIAELFAEDGGEA